MQSRRNGLTHTVVNLAVKIPRYMTMDTSGRRGQPLAPDGDVRNNNNNVRKVGLLCRSEVGKERLEVRVGNEDGVQFSRYVADDFDRSKFERRAAAHRFVRWGVGCRRLLLLKVAVDCSELGTCGFFSFIAKENYITFSINHFC